jgi:hypothetical protein
MLSCSSSSRIKPILQTADLEPDTFDYASFHIIHMVAQQHRRQLMSEVLKALKCLKKAVEES